MATTPAGKSVLRIRQLRGDYLVSSAHPAPERVRATLDEVVTKRLPETLAAMLSSLLPENEESLWFLRRLEIAVDVNAAWNPDELARAWTAQIARALIEELAGASDCVVRFADRPAYLARFARDLAEGSAWSKWYYSPFEGLRLLPLSAAIRTALMEEPQVGLAALLRLTASEQNDVLRALTTQDARRVLEAMVSGAEGDEPMCFRAAWSAWEEAELEPFQAATETRNALRLVLRVRNGRAELGGLPLKRAVLALLRWARRLVSASTAESARLLDVLMRQDLASLYVIAGASDAEVLAPLQSCPPDWTRAVGSLLQERVTGQAMPEESAESKTTEAGYPIRDTPFGGVFLLLPLLEELPLEEATEGWPDAGPVSAETAVRFLLFVKCCGQERAHRVFLDPLVRDLFGIPPTLTPARVAEWQKSLSRVQCEQFRRGLGAWQRANGRVESETLILARVVVAGRVQALLMDGAGGVWLFAGACDPRRLESLAERLGDWLTYPLAPSLKERGTNEARGDSLAPFPLGEGLGRGNRHLNARRELLCDTTFVTPFRAVYPELTIVPLEDDEAARKAAENVGLAELLIRRNDWAQDAAYLALPPGLRGSLEADRMMSVAAQSVLRAFSGRLAGFARSGLPYLYRNFLDFPGSLEEEPTRRIARLGKPPLSLILNMAGMARGVYRLSRLDERPFALFPEG